MADDALALAMQPDSPSEDEYQAFLRALSETARGRAFLAEHARRSRAEDSATLLSSVQRLEGLVRNQTETPPEPIAPSPFDEVRDLLEVIRDKQDTFDPGALTAQIGMLADMIESVHQRIDILATPAPVEAAPEEIALPLEEAAAPADELVTAEETAFATPDQDALAEPDVAAEVEPVVEAEADAASATPASEPVFDIAPETELPPESVAVEAEAQPALEAEGLVPPLEIVPAEDTVNDAPAEPVQETDLPAEATSAIPEVAWGAGEAATENTPTSDVPAPDLAIAALVETLVVPEADERLPEVKVIKAGTIPPPAPFAGEDFSSGKRARVALPPVDPLADIKALSEEERVALFT